ncbi:hypothetical protein ACHAWT_001297 [Skeletonema menzelii]
MGTDSGMLLGVISLEKLKLKELQDKATAASIDIMTTPATKTQAGWKGRGIGLLAAAYARGWVDKKNLKKYQAMKHDSEGNSEKNYSLQYLIGQCTDFQNELTQLEFVCAQQGAAALITPKYHAELAGEGIEYTWGLAKCHYRRYQLKEKKGKQNFEKLMRKCLSRDFITAERVRKFSKRARGYMETYVVIEMEEDVNTKGTPIPNRKIEQLKKVMKCHRAALDFDKGFLMTFVTGDGFDYSDLDKKPPATKKMK